MKHCTIIMTDGTKQAICSMPYEKLMVLIVWHRLNGDPRVFDQIYDFAKQANESDLGHECQQCGAQLIMLSNDPEFADLKRHADAMKIGDIIR